MAAVEAIRCKLSKGHVAHWVVGGVAMVTLLWHLAWIARFRTGYITEWDESGYLSIALKNTRSLLDGGLTDFVRTVVEQDLQAPGVPLAAVPLQLVFGRSVTSALAVEAVAAAALVVATYALATRVLPRSWSVVAACTVACVPGLVDYARLFHFALPATVFHTAAVAALLRSDAFRHRRWVLAGGVLLGGMILCRTMTLAYLPGPAAALVVQGLVRGAFRARLRNAVLLPGAVLLTAGWWFLPNARSVGHYLVGTGYGEASTAKSGGTGPLDPAYWTVQLRVLLREIHLVLGAVSLIAVVAAAIGASRRARGLRQALVRLLASDVGSLVVIIVSGYVAATSASHDDQGTGFLLPWIPCLVVLVLVAVRAAGPRVRPLLLGGVFAAALIGAGTKSGVALPGPDVVRARVPGLGRVAVFDKFSPIYDEVRGAGFLVDPDERMNDLHRRWLPAIEAVIEDVLAVAGDLDRHPDVAIGSADLLVANTRFALASELLLQRALEIHDLKPIDGDAADAYVAQFAEHGSNVLVVVPGRNRATSDAVDVRAVRAAARRAGFTLTRRRALPDGRQVEVWVMR